MNPRTRGQSVAVTQRAWLIRPVRIAAMAIILCHFGNGLLTPVAGQQPVAVHNEPSLQERVAAIRASFAQSQAKLKGYEWMETTTIFLKDEEKSRTVKRCYYGAEGKIQKVTVEAPATEKPGRGLRGRIKENKKEELADYVTSAVELVTHYVPPQQDLIQAAHDSGKVSLQIVEPGKRINVTLSDYRKPTDSFSIMLDIEANRLMGLEIKTFLDQTVPPGKDPKDPVVMEVKQSAFPDGTLYTERVELEMASKNLKVIVEHSGYLPLSVTPGAGPAAVVPALAAAVSLASQPLESEGEPQAEPVAQGMATDVGWPRVFESDGKQLTVHQPQIDQWNNYETMTFRCAISVKGVLTEECFGVAEIEADTLVDHASRMVALTPTSRTLRFANIPEADAAMLRAAVDAIRPPSSVTIIALDQVLAYVDASELKIQHTVDVNLEPPNIYYSAEPAVLVIFIGKPVFRPVNPERPGLDFAINTNWDVLYSNTTKQYYLLDGDGWITSSDPINSPWSPITALPFSPDTFPADDNWAETRKHVPGTPLLSAPRVFITTEPAELIVTDGPPGFELIPNTNLARVSNTDSVLFRNTSDSKFYYLAAGRWFSAESLTGPWAAASTSLPADFAAIPDGNDSDFVKASVPGTQAAKDALLLASVPNTTTVSLTEPPVQVVYSGEPKFVVVDGTQAQYAVNTSYSVFFAEGSYYCCDQGVWFVAAAPMGPWSFCAAVPQVIYLLPPSNPHYNVTYVTVEAATPTTVTYAQTSGYSGEYVATTGVLMFGAGILVGAALADDDHSYYYPPYPCHYSYGCGARYHYGYGGYYSAAHVSYGPYGGAGRSASYNPATGTYARGAYAYGPYGSAQASAAYNPYSGARAAAGQVDTAYGSAGRAVGYNPTTGNYARGGYTSGQYGSAGFAQVGNAYTGRSASVGGATTNQGGSIAAWNTQYGQGMAAKTESGNVYASHDGNVYKKGDDGTWSSNSGSSWQTTTTQARTTTSGTPQQQRQTSTGTTQGPRSLESQAEARERGNARTNQTRNYQTSRHRTQSTGGNRSSGAGRRGR